LPNNHTIDMLRSFTRDPRNTIWRNAKVSNSPLAPAFVETIETLGLPYGETGGVADDDPDRIPMCDIVDSPEGKAAYIKATENGLPAMSGVDPILGTLWGELFAPPWHLNRRIRCCRSDARLMVCDYRASRSSGVICSQDRRHLET